MSRTIFSLIGFVLMLPVSGNAFAVDPTQPPRNLAPLASDAEPAVPLRLQAILRAPDNLRAVVNGQTLKVGERVANARLLAVYPHSVLIEREGQRQTLRLSAPVIKASHTKP